MSNENLVFALKAEESIPQQQNGKRAICNNNTVDALLPKGRVIPTSNQIEGGVADDYDNVPSPSGPNIASSEKQSAPSRCELLQGDCLEHLKTLDDNFIDFICTDAPYGLGIKNAKWDKLPSVEIWKESLRVLKPGAFAYIMSSVRQDLFSKMIMDLSEAGFKTGFPSIYWTYHSKVRARVYNIAKKIDLEASDAPEIFKEQHKDRYYANPKTPLAKKFIGATPGFCPIPAVEIIIVVMKPIDRKNYFDQALATGKGITRFHNCRIPIDGTKHGRSPSTLLVSDNVLGSHSKYFNLDQWAHEKMLNKVPDELKETFPFINVPKPGTREKNAGLNIKNIHLTVKPIKLFNYLIEMGSWPGDLVLDPFMGSGTTCVAAAGLDRNFIGIELLEEHYNIAAQRVRNEVLRKAA